MLMKESVKKSVKKSMIITSIIVLILGLFILHPLLRTVESQTITYTIWGVDMKEQSLILTATKNAFVLWEMNNPELIFEEGDGGMTIVFTEYLPFKDGLAVCPFWSNSENGCYILVSPDSCNQYTYPANKNCLTNVLAHEIGHVLGMMHAATNDNLMSGPVYGWNFDDRGFNVPKPLEPNAGQ